MTSDERAAPIFTLPCGSCGGNSWHNGCESSGSPCAYCRDGEVCIRMTPAMVEAARTSRGMVVNTEPERSRMIAERQLRAALEAARP